MSKKQIDCKSLQTNSFDLSFEVTKKFKLKDSHREFVTRGFDDAAKIMFVDGPAGSAKTFCAAYLGLNLLKTRQVEEIVYIRSIIESASKSMGALPGEVDDKFYPWSIPLQEKLDELLKPGVSRSLFESGRVRAIPVNYVRGLTFADAFVIVDEAQNLTHSELVTIMTRFGNNSKMVIVGDTRQSDINGKSGFMPMYEVFDDAQSRDNGVFTYKFTEQDIMRSEILKFLVSKISSI